MTVGTSTSQPLTASISSALARGWSAGFSRASNSSIIRVSIDVRQLARDDDDRAGAGHDGLLRAGALTAGTSRKALSAQTMAATAARLQTWAAAAYDRSPRHPIEESASWPHRFLCSRRSGLALLLGSLAATAPLAAQDTTQRTVGASGLPLPRFASLAASQVNVRTGPSTDHPIRWVYERAGAAGADRRGVATSGAGSRTRTARPAGRMRACCRCGAR